MSDTQRELNFCSIMRMCCVYAKGWQLERERVLWEGCEALSSGLRY